MYESVFQSKTIDTEERGRRGDELLPSVEWL